MKTTQSELTQRYLVLIKIDAKNLFDRIHDRQHQYIEVFSLKRERSIFKEIFENRYTKMTIENLSNIPTEVIELANKFYTMIDELYWYLKRTQDMPNTIEDEVSRQVAKLDRKNENLQLYINAILTGEDL